MSGLLSRRMRTAFEFTILTEPGVVQLVAGEDLRYTLAAPGLDQWLPDFIRQLDGRSPLNELLATLTLDRRSAAQNVLERLDGERVLVEGTALEAHASRDKKTVRLEPQGSGELLDLLAPFAEETKGAAIPLPVLCQDRLDYHEALLFNQRCRRDGLAWLWASTGPVSRGYVGPVFLPDAGACFACLLRHFQRLSPAPQFYDNLIAHARAERPIPGIPCPSPAAAILTQWVIYKAKQFSQPDPPAALYRLHVLELDNMEVSSHRVFADPECPECSLGASVLA